MKKAISPVIATVIIVAVTIAIAIAVALWMSGLVGSFTATENLQITSGNAEKNPGSGWTIYLTVKNTGTTDVTIDNIFVNGKPLTQKPANITVKYDSTTIDDLSNIQIPLKSGESRTIIIDITYASTGIGTFSSGQMVEVKLHTASGRDYPRQVTLP